MNNMLLFFALPVGTILLSIVLQKLLNSPTFVAITAFGIYLIVTFSAFNESFLIYAIVYTLIAYVTAVITRFIFKLLHCQNINNNTETALNIDENDISNNTVLNSGSTNMCNCLSDRNYRCNRRY